MNAADRVISNYFMSKSKWGETKTMETLLCEEIEYKKIFDLFFMKKDRRGGVNNPCTSKVLGVRICPVNTPFETKRCSLDRKVKKSKTFNYKEDC